MRDVKAKSDKEERSKDEEEKRTRNDSREKRHKRRREVKKKSLPEQLAALPMRMPARYPSHQAASSIAQCCPFPLWATVPACARAVYLWAVRERGREWSSAWNGYS